MIRFIVPLIMALVTACAGPTTVAYTPTGSPTTMVEVRPGLFVAPIREAPAERRPERRQRASARGVEQALADHGGTR